MENATLRDRFLRRLAPDDQLLRLFDQLPDVSFFLKDCEGRFLALNRRGCDYCGVAREGDAVGCTDYDFFPPQRADAYRADDRAVMESGDPIVDRIEGAPDPVGSPRLVMTSKWPLRDRRGRVIGLAGFSRQVEQVRAPAGTVDRFARVVDHLQRHYHEPLTTADLARRAGMSVSQFERRFRRAFGASPRQYLLRIRVEAAARLLLETDDTVAAIAQACGFHDHAHLSRRFRRFLHQSPSEYRRAG